MGRLTGKSVIVTGASRGIGAAAAEALAAEGAALLLLARSGAEVSALAARLRAGGATAEAMAGWARCTSGPVRTLEVPGGHHGLYEHPDLLHAALDEATDGPR